MEQVNTVQSGTGAMTMRQADEDGMRAGMYGLLAHLLAGPPSPAMLALLDETGREGGAADDLATAWQLLRMAVRDHNPAAVDDEYHDLFIGIGRGEVVPYASWYLTGFLMDRPLACLRRDLGRLGIERRPGTSDPEDHAATLCESMRVIITAADIPFPTARQFFLDHIATWMPVFFRDLQQARAACLYAAVGGLGEAFMKFETRYLELEE
jgi:TorA maturation chaperone TorD